MAHVAPNVLLPGSSESRERRAARGRFTSLRSSVVVGAVAVAAQAAIVVPFLGRYGWDRDELYFLSAARRLTWGYVDFPPLTAWIGWLVHALFGDSLVALRLTCLVAMMVTVVLVALIARELGAGLHEKGRRDPHSHSPTPSRKDQSCKIHSNATVLRKEGLR